MIAQLKDLDRQLQDIAMNFPGEVVGNSLFRQS
jgi:hypothetical protein